MSHRTLVLTAAAALAAFSGGGLLHAQPVPPAGSTPAGEPASTAAPAPASADAKERARALHAAGLRHYEARQYGRAIAAYRKAYAIYPAPGILFNLAQAYRLRGDCRRAHRAYRSFLHADSTSAQATLAREHASALSGCAARAQRAKEAREAAAATAAAAPAAPAATTPAPVTPAPAPPPDPQLSSSSPFDSTPPASPAEAPAATSIDFGGARRDVEPGRRKKLLGVGVGTAGAALLVVGIYYGLQARSAASDLDDFFAEGGTWTPELGERQDSLGRDRLLSVGFGLAGAGAIGGGAFLYWLGRNEAAAARIEQPPITIAPRTDGATLLWRRTF
jgi:tetratricopeptide (TPR) repeat protein